MNTIEELEAVADRLLKQARELPPGPERIDALKEAGRLRSRLADLRHRDKAQ